MRSDTTLNPELKPELKPEPKPETATQQLQLGHHCFDQGQFDQAIVHYRHALFADPTQTEIYQYLAEALSQVGDLAEAAACYRQAIDLTASSAAELTQLPTESPQEQQSQSQTAIGVSDRTLHPHWIRLNPEQKPDDAQSENGSVNCSLHGKGNGQGAIITHETELYLTQAENAYKQEKWRDTVTYCHHLLQSQPNVSAYKLLGNALQRLGQFSEAVDAYLSAIQLAPQAADIYANLGSLYAQQQRWQDAVVYYQSAIAINPDFAGVYRNLARVWVQLAQSDKAMECWYRTFKLEPEKVSAEEQINLGNWLLGQNRIEAAIDCYHQAIQLAPTLAAGYQNLAAALTRQGKTQEAAPFYCKAQELGLEIPAVALSSQAAGATVIPSVSTHGKPMTDDRIAASYSFNGNGIYRSNGNSDGNGNGNENKRHSSVPGVLTPPSRLGRAETQLATAADYFEQEQWDEAIVASAEALQQLEPELVQTYRHLADAFYAKKQLTEAIRYARRVVELEPNSAADRVNLGSLYAQQEEWQAALDCYQTAIALDANLASAHWNLAKVWEVIDRPEQATTAFFQALALEPSWASLSEHLTLAHTLRSQSQQDSALACYQQVIQRDATCAEAYAALAEMFAQQQQWQNSVTHYQQAIQHDPKNLNYLVSFGQVLAAVQQWQAAITVYRQVIRLDPQPAHYLTLAQFLERQEQWDEAIECYQTLATLQPRWEVAHKLGDLLNRQQRWPEAVIAFRQAIELNPDYSWSHNNLGDALIHMEQWQEAAAVFRQAIELHPDFHWSHYNLGEALAKLEQWDGAIVAYRRALELDSDTPYIQQKLGNALHQRARLDLDKALWYCQQAIDKYPDDEQNYHKALEIQPNNVDLYLGLGNALAKKRRLDEAIIFYQIALQIHPDHVQTASQLEKVLQLKQHSEQEPIYDSVELYNFWLSQNALSQDDLGRAKISIAGMEYQPLISIVMPVYNTPELFLREAIESVLDQIYSHWELCIADDASNQSHIRKTLEEYRAKDSRIKVVFRERNGHISAASNSALDLATGEFLALLDHDDLLAPDALYEVVALLNQSPQADMIYSDEDKLNEQGQRIHPFFKPDWCPDSFLTRMYTCHLGVYRRSLVEQIGRFRVGYEGSQDYDLVLRLTEQTQQVFHIPKVLYHWRISSTSVASDSSAKPYAYEAGTKAIQDALHRRGENGQVLSNSEYPGTYSVRYEITAYKLVSIIIPTRNLGHILDRCLKSIFTKSTYPNYEVILIDNGSDEPETLDIIKTWVLREPDRFKCYPLDVPFNYSRINNYAVEQAKGDYLLFLNNDTEVITSDWIEGMVEQTQRDSIGAVGALLLYPDDTIQHAGVVVGLGGVAGHSHKHFPLNHPGYMRQIVLTNNYSAVTAACLMCRREIFKQVNGFDEALAVAFNDVDFCLKIQQAGYCNVYLPHVVLYHHESKSRGYEDTLEKQLRFKQEMATIQQRWSDVIQHDPCYNPHLTRDREDFSLHFPRADTRILNIELYPRGSDNILDFAIDAPHFGQEVNSHYIICTGWIIGQNFKPIAIQIIQEDQIIGVIPVSQFRPDVIEAYPHALAVETSGFHGALTITEMSSYLELSMQVIFENGSQALLGRIELARSA